MTRHSLFIQLVTATVASALFIITIQAEPAPLCSPTQPTTLEQQAILKRAELGEKLMNAIVADKAEEVEALLAAGTPIDYCRQDNMTPLHVAAARNNIAVARLLISAGAPINHRHSKGFTPLDLAASMGHMLTASLLISSGASLNHRDPEGGATPLHEATLKGNIALARLLIDAGALTNIQDKHGTTPLHVAATMGDSAITALLIAADASLDHQNADGVTPLHTAVCAYSPKNQRLLRIMQQQIGHPIAHPAVYRDVIDQLLTAGAAVDLADNFGRTPLTSAAADGNTACTVQLLKAGAATDSQDKDGDSPLMWAIASKHTATIKAILAARASADLQNRHGLTALIYAIKAQCQCGGNLDNIAMLFERTIPLTREQQQKLTTQENAILLDLPEHTAIIQARIKAAHDWYLALEHTHNLPRTITHLLMHMGGEVPKEQMPKMADVRISDQ